MNIAYEAMMSKKTCSGCYLSLPFAAFNACQAARHGLHNHCRKCQVLARRKYTEQNQEHEAEAAAAYRASSKGKIAFKERYHSDEVFKNRILEYNRKRRRALKPRMLANAAKRRLEALNPSVKLARNIRGRVRKALIGINKSSSTLKLLGCTIKELRSHLESLFKPRMSWDNYGYYGWHIDHIKPCAAHDLTDPLQQQSCFHFTNLQPSWRFENQSKNKRWLV